jgi:hypothetical protein
MLCTLTSDEWAALDLAGQMLIARTEQEEGVA